MEDPSTAAGAPRARPLPRPQRWTLDVAAPGEVTSWQQPAQRLVAVLREVGSAVRDEYGKPVIWQAADEAAVDWSDPDAVHKLMDRSHTAEAGARGLVHGHLSDPARPPIVDVLWRAGADGRVLDCTARFNPRGGVRALARHDPEWLVALLGFTVDVASGNAGRIVTSSWLKEDERRMRDGVPASGMVPFWLGEVTFVPVTVDPAQLPDSLVAHPWPTRTGVGSVVALADLTATIVAPSQAVDAMLTLRRHLPGS